MIELALSSGEIVPLKISPVRKFRGTRLPGSALYLPGKPGFSISVQQYDEPQFSICYRNIFFPRPTKLNTREKSSALRLETVLTGELHIQDLSGNSMVLLPVQYHITDTVFFQSSFEQHTNCSYFSAYYSRELLDRMGLSITPGGPKVIPAAMKELIFELLENPFDEELRPFYYENCLRQLLFFHLSAPNIPSPGELTDADLASIYYADRIISENLNSHFTIRTLARKAGTNEFVLKKGFQRLFGIGVFGRLLQRRMDKAKYLLENTNKPIKDVCELSGYETVAGFITAFRKKFGLTPRVWRKKNRGEM
jgi:AraC-like DNA-binding protein